MSSTLTERAAPASLFLLGNEALARGALDAGITAAYGYPGTPSTEALEALRRGPLPAGVIASWCTNEKAALEAALGVSMVGRRSLVVMKHVGLNVAADPFMNGALVSIRGGLVVAVADDPGMHSSQNEQDSRFYADFARVPCLEPANHQQAYDSTRLAFEISERFQVPVLVRLVTRLAHSRGEIETAAPLSSSPPTEPLEARAWTLLPVNARRQWGRLVESQMEIEAALLESGLSRYEPSDDDGGLGVITAGIGLGYYLEHRDELERRPSHLHVGGYPAPIGAIRELCSKVSRVLVLEDGYPFVERMLRGWLTQSIEIAGRQSGEVPATGELGPEVVRRALGLTERTSGLAVLHDLPPRPPQLCGACPHRDTFTAMSRALEGLGEAVVAGDVGCYTLGALPPFQAIESCVCMGAAVGMARGAAEAGSWPVLGVIGDSTFLHSGLAPLIDAIEADADMTLLILDNDAVGMTGAQDPALPPSRLADLVVGLGLERAHCHVIDAHPRKIEEMARVIRGAVEHRGLSVVISVRECVEHARRRKSEARRANTAAAPAEDPS